MKISMFKALFAVLLALAAGVAAMAQQRPDLLKTIDERLAALRRDAGPLLASGTYFRSARELLDFINRSAVDPKDKYDRIEAVVTDALAVRPADGARREAVIREKRNVLLTLLGARLDDVDGTPDYAGLRARYSRSLVEFVRSLKADLVADYQPRPVYANMPVDGRDSEAVRAEKYRNFVAENQRNNDANRYQEALQNELQFLRPKVISFLNSNYGNSASDRAELQRLLELLA